MFESIRFTVWRLSRWIADAVVISPVIRWSWRGYSDDTYVSAISEYRPADRETISEMMAGRYLLASRLINTGGVSPFSIETKEQLWLNELHSFSWLRHFREARDNGERSFARTLVLDWIGRNSSGFDHAVWRQRLTAQRILNWLRHYNALVEGATPNQIRSIASSLGTQIQSLRLRGDLSVDPIDQLLCQIALTGVALCETNSKLPVTRQVTLLLQLLKDHICEEGLCKTRNPADQLVILTELASIRTALVGMDHDLAPDIAHTTDAMHRALGRLTLGSGEPAYFNNCGQLPVDHVISVQAQTTVRDVGGGRICGYGVLADGKSRLIVDSGVVPPLRFARGAHAGALSFEFSHGNDVVVGNCGPAPANIPQSGFAFRLPAAHSGVTIGDRSNARMGGWPVLSGYLKPDGPPPEITELAEEETGLVVSTRNFASRFGIEVERRLSLLPGGETLVGQDRIEAAGTSREYATYVARFHLGANAEAWHGAQRDLISIRLQSGVLWSFLWEGAAARIDDSIRHSAYFGFNRTKQIVLTAESEPGREIAWIFTRQTG